MDQQVEISVIVPIYNVEEYIAECLDSLEAQRFDALEVIMVDDGSTDSSGQIARSYAERLPHFHYYCKENGGQGQARNVGVTYAQGTYLAFCDSDDIIPEYAYKHLYELAQRTDCDIAIGTAVQFNSQGRMQSVLHKHAFAHAPQKLSALAWPKLLYDNVVCDKLIRRDFYEGRDIRFPEGMAYEDVATVVPMLSMTERIAYLDEVVYLWRKREGDTLSTTQKRALPGNLEDRLRAIEAIDAYYSQHVEDDQLVRAKDRKIVDFDLILFINSLSSAEPGRRDEMMGLLAAAAEKRREHIAGLDPLKRIKYHYLLARNYASLEQAIAFGDEGYASVQAQRGPNGEFMGQFPFKGLPAELADMTHAFKANRCSTRVQGVILNKETCSVEGYVYLRGYDMQPEKSVEVKAQLVHVDDPGVQIALEVDASIVTNEHIASDGAMPHVCSFRAQVPTEALRTTLAGTYRLKLQLIYDGFICDPVFAGHPLEGRAARPYALRDDKRYYAVRYRVWRDFSLVVGDVNMPRIKSARADGEDLVLTDAEGVEHRVAGEDIDFEAKRIGDPAHMPYCYFAKVPLLAAYKGGVIRLGRSTQGSPVVSMLSDTVFVKSASVADGVLTVRIGEFDDTPLTGSWLLNLVDGSGHSMLFARGKADAKGRAVFAIGAGQDKLPDGLQEGVYQLELANAASGETMQLRCMPKDMKKKLALRVDVGAVALALKLNAVRPALVVENLQ